MKNKPLFFLVLFLLSAWDSYAVFVATGTPNANTSAPADDQGWSSMGIYNGAGAVYLGNGWFITAGHLGPGGSTVKFNAVNYSIASTSWKNITNSNGTTVDAYLFKISNPLAIAEPGVGINALSLNVGFAVTMIGYGRNVSSVLTNQYFSKGTQTQVRYYESTTSQMKWATNTVSGSQVAYTNAGFSYKSDVFITTLNPGKAQALDKDSGGGVFVNNGSSWNLAGIMIGALRYQDTNGIFAVTDTGSPSLNSKTYCVDLSLYRSQITNIVAIVDLDGDALPDWWEFKYSNSSTSLLASADSDGDGFSNLREWEADTNPTNAASFFTNTGLFTLTDQTFYFTGSTARQYQVFYTTNDLLATNLTWIAAHTNKVRGVGTNSSITVSNMDETAFYRLWVSLP